MTSTKSALLAAVSAAAITCALAIPALAADAPAPVPQNDNLNAVLWDQTSVEFKAVTTGEYALAKMRLDQALADKSWTAATEQTGSFGDLPPAVILDVDDTTVNTSAYQAWTVTAGTAYSGKTWGPYVAAEQDVALPGAVDFTQYAASKGVKVVYVTNRTADQEAPTKEEMTKMGFPDGGNVDTYLMSKEQPDWTSAKGTRRAFIAKNYRILLLLGDNMGDFTDQYGGSVADRDKVYAATAAHWGHDWIALPNPTYGSFESAPYLTDYSKSVDEQRAEKLQALKPWVGPSHCRVRLRPFRTAGRPAASVRGSELDADFLEPAPDDAAGLPRAARDQQVERVGNADDRAHLQLGALRRVIAHRAVDGRAAGVEHDLACLERRPALDIAMFGVRCGLHGWSPSTLYLGVECGRTISAVPRNAWGFHQVKLMTGRSLGVDVERHRIGVDADRRDVVRAPAAAFQCLRENRIVADDLGEPGGVAEVDRPDADAERHHVHLGPRPDGLHGLLAHDPAHAVERALALRDEVVGRVDGKGRGGGKGCGKQDRERDSLVHCRTPWFSTLTHRMDVGSARSREFAARRLLQRPGAWPL